MLQPYIETYWAFDGYIEGEMKHRVLPDGCVDIILSLHRNEESGTMKAFSPYIVGTMTAFSEVIYTNKVKMMGIRFRPAGITAFTRTPINLFTDEHIDLQSGETIFDDCFFESLEEKSEVIDILSHIDDYLLSKLPYLFLPDKRVLHAISLIKQTSGNIPISLLAEESCLSKRQLERCFMNNTGVSPKTFSRIMKFCNAHRFLQTATKQSLFETAVDCGYYDHAHLIKEFKTLSGLSPSEF